MDLIEIAGYNATQIDAAKEYEDRYQEAMARYHHDLFVKNNLIRPKTYKPPAKQPKHPKDLRVADFDPSTYYIKPVKLETLQAFLKRKGKRYTSYRNPETCVKCRDGPIWGQVIHAYEKELADLIHKAEQEKRHVMQGSDFRDLQHKLKKAKDKYDEFLRHQKDMKTARAYANKIRDEMKVGECFVTRDFVNHHDHDGGHVKCLHLVVQFRQVEGGPLHKMKIRNYCSDKDTLTTNHGYVVDVMRYHLQEKEEGIYPGLFDQFQKIYIAGDHGGHFSNAGTMIEESKFYREFGKEIHLCYYPPYHAHGLADQAGAEDKKQARKDKINDCLRIGAADYTAMTNGSNDARSIAFEFSKINRSISAYTTRKDRVKAVGLPQWSEV